MMIMIMAMIIMRKNEGGTYQRSWKSTPLVMDKARGGALLENYSDKSWFVAWLSRLVMRSWHSGCPWWEGRLGQYRTLWCWELSGKKIWFISWASWASELRRYGWRSELTVVTWVGQAVQGKVERSSFVWTFGQNWTLEPLLSAVWDWGTWEHT